MLGVAAMGVCLLAKDWGKVFLSGNCNVTIPSSRDILYYILDMSPLLLIAFPCTTGFPKIMSIQQAGIPKISSIL